ncbi:hypothetical protein [Candidatus Electrothrix sp.]|uniref:hypothetical protein n=1 Tax=Candidatus Electrothrix sp. TaxID=2170559 RepID=UPI0040568FBF
MPYSEFTIKQVKEEFDLAIIENRSLFGSVEEALLDDSVRKKLDEYVPLALAVNTEKARSEFIIAYLLLELRAYLDSQVSLFSGIDFDVDKEKRLNGFCDFIISLSTEQFFLTSPIIAVVEAKNENIIGGIGQCLAEMIAARIFNEREGNTVKSIYGVVTTGSVWKFLKLTGNEAVVDRKEYHIEQAGKIMGILAAMVRQVV